jgi:hypothetical protein
VLNIEDAKQGFLARWRERREDYHRLRASVDAAALIDEFLTDVDQVWRRHDDERLTLNEASAESGYSVDHLGRLLRDGKLTNVGRPRAPRVRRGDLPRRPRRQSGTLASASDLPYDVNADVRSLRTVRRGE